MNRHLLDQDDLLTSHVLTSAPLFARFRFVTLYQGLCCVNGSSLWPLRL